MWIASEKPFDNVSQVLSVKDNRRFLDAQSTPHVLKLIFYLQEQVFIDCTLSQKLTFVHVIETFLFGFYRLEETAENVILVLIDF